MSTAIKGVNKLREYIKKNKANNYPITDHPLAGVTDYVKNLYLKMLGVILVYGEDVKEEQTLLLKRIIKGISTDSSVEDYMRQALDIEEKKFEEFVVQMKELNIKYIFAVDAMLLVFISDKPREEQIELIAEIAEMLGIVKAELGYLVAVSRSIIEQSSELYHEAETLRPEAIDYEDFFCYSKKYVTCIIYNTEKYLTLSSDKPNKFNLNTLRSGLQDEYSVVCSQSEVVMKNLIIDVSKDILFFKANESIKFINCEFYGGPNSLFFTACKDITITNCTFRNFTSRTIVLDKVSNVKFDGCYFNNCHYEYTREANDWEELGGVIYSYGRNDVNSLHINSCEFKECGGINTANYYSSAIISNCFAQVSNSKFINCWNYNRDNYTDPEENRRRLFLAGLYNNNNEIIGSAKFS